MSEEEKSNSEHVDEGKKDIKSSESKPEITGSGDAFDFGNKVGAGRSPDDVEEKSDLVTIDDIKSGKAETLFTETVDDEIDDVDVVERGKFFAIISYMLVLCLVPVFLKKKNRFAVFHAKQGIILFIWYVVAATIKCIFGRVWLLGSFLGPIGAFIKGISVLLILLFSVVGMYQASTGSYWRLPMVLGDWAEELEVGE